MTGKYTLPIMYLFRRISGGIANRLAFGDYGEEVISVW